LLADEKLAKKVEKSSIRQSNIESSKMFWKQVETEQKFESEILSKTVEIDIDPYIEPLTTESMMIATPFDFEED
jgi:hypothetical protein